MVPGSVDPAAGHLLSVDPDECRSLLRETVVGRVSWRSTVGLVTLPVTYGVHHDGRIAFRVAETGLLAELALGAEVAFEADDLDAETLTGWSVLVQGEAARWAGDFPAGLRRPWAPGQRTLAIQISPSTYSGRSVSADSAPNQDPASEEWTS